MSLYGRTISDDQVEDAIRTTIRRWIDTEMRIVEEGLGLPARHYGRPRSYEIHSDLDKYPEEQLPAVLVATIGLTDTHSYGSRAVGKSGKEIAATYGIAILSIASSSDMDKARMYANRLAAAVRGCMIHNQSLDKQLDGTVEGIGLESAQPAMPLDADRSLWGVRQVFTITVGNIITKNAGPVDPDEPPPDDQPLPSWGQIPDIDHIKIFITEEA